jgi:hypothetical protein
VKKAKSSQINWPRYFLAVLISGCLWWSGFLVFKHLNTPKEDECYSHNINAVYARVSIVDDYDVIYYIADLDDMKNELKRRNVKSFNDLYTLDKSCKSYWLARTLVGHSESIKSLYDKTDELQNRGK